MLRFEVNFFVYLGSRENVVSDRNVVNEDALELVCLGAKNLVFLECFQIVNGEVANDGAAFGNGRLLTLL